MSLVGKKAPIFSASAVIDGGEISDNFSLEQFIGNKEVLFFFYTKDFSGVCPTEMHAFQEKLEEFDKRGVAVVGCSTDSEESHLTWLNMSREQGGIKGITFPIVADATKTIASNCGVLGGDWSYSEDRQLRFQGSPVALRASFFIDKEGIIRHESVNFFTIGRRIDEFIRVADAWHYFLNNGESCPANWQEGDNTTK
jgi:peroxiredoxin 2/4